MTLQTNQNFGTNEVGIPGPWIAYVAGTLLRDYYYFQYILLPTMESTTFHNSNYSVRNK